MSKTISNREDLCPFGINPLTGEACRVGMRVLCDVTEQGKKTVLDLLGLPADTKLAKNWNSGGVGSVMVPYDLFPQLRVWCLLLDGARVVAVLKGGEAVGLYPEDYDSGEAQKLLEHYHKYGQLDRTYHVMGSLPGEGTRCTHQMSGRTE